MSRAKRVFLAAPLYSEAERQFNAKVAEALRVAGYAVWLPQDAPFIKQGSAREKRRIFNGDTTALKRSDLVLAILDGPRVEEGVAFEIGVAYALGKTLLGLKTDYRSFSPIENVNLLLEVPIAKIHHSIADVIKDLGRRL